MGSMASTASAGDDPKRLTFWTSDGTMRPVSPSPHPTNKVSDGSIRKVRVFTFLAHCSRGWFLPAPGARDVQTAGCVHHRGSVAGVIGGGCASSSQSNLYSAGTV